MSTRKSPILEHIWMRPGGYRKQIASALGFHPNCVSDAVRELIAEGWVTEGEPRTGNSGRAPISLYIDLERRAILSVSYDRQGTIFALVDPAGNIIEKIESNQAPADPEDLVERIVQDLGRLTENYTGELIGVGLADPGMIDSAAGEVVRSSHFPDWHHVPLAALLEKKTSLPVLVENNTRARAMAQYSSMPELRQAASSMLYLDYGEGVGFAFVTSDGVWRGSGLAGELGHVVLERGGGLCGCGARGCLESLVNSSALEAKAKDLLARGVNSILQGRDGLEAKAIFQAALDGDRLARGLIEEMISRLGLAMAFLVVAFHPEYLVVGAESEAEIRCLCRELASAIHDRILPEIASSVEIIEGKEFRFMALTGVALMVFRKTIMQENGVLVSMG